MAENQEMSESDKIQRRLKYGTEQKGFTGNPNCFQR